MEYSLLDESDLATEMQELSYIDENITENTNSLDLRLSEPATMNQKYIFETIELKEILIEAVNAKITIDIETNNEKQNEEINEINEIIDKIESFEPKFNKLQDELDQLNSEYNNEKKNTENNIKKLESSILFMKSFEIEYKNNDENVKDIIDKLNKYSSTIKENDKLLQIKENYISKRKELHSYLYFIQKLNKWNTCAICPICITNRIDSYCNPCGHTACKECLTRNNMINNNSYNSNKCPICREYINEIRKLFFI